MFFPRNKYEYLISLGNVQAIWVFRNNIVQKNTSFILVTAIKVTINCQSMHIEALLCVCGKVRAQFNGATFKNISYDFILTSSLAIITSFTAHSWLVQARCSYNSKLRIRDICSVSTSVSSPLQIHEPKINFWHPSKCIHYTLSTESNRMQGKVNGIAVGYSSINQSNASYRNGLSSVVYRATHGDVIHIRRTFVCR